MTKQVLPDRIWVCGFCRAQFIEAWRLKRHLMLSHDMSETKAWAITDMSEYWLRVKRAVHIEEEEPGPESTAVKRDNRRRSSKR